MNEEKYKLLDNDDKFRNEFASEMKRLYFNFMTEQEIIFWVKALVYGRTNL